MIYVLLGIASIIFALVLCETFYKKLYVEIKNESKIENISYNNSKKKKAKSLRIIWSSFQDI
jgi:hypothetical protein